MLSPRESSLPCSQVLINYLSQGKPDTCKTAGRRLARFFCGGSSHLPSDWDALTPPLPITGYMFSRSKAPGRASCGVVSLQITPATFLRATEQSCVQDNVPSLSAGHSNSSTVLREGFYVAPGSDPACGCPAWQWDSDVDKVEDSLACLASQNEG